MNLASFARTSRRRSAQAKITPSSVITPPPGAATGAASGASIDLVTGGLTLGAATALGALIGGGAAFAGAAWKNRATPAGTTLVQISDDMLQAVAAAALLRYLTIADFARSARANGSGETAALWEGKVVAAVEAKKEIFMRFWADTRAQQSQPQTAGAFGGELQKIMLLVLDELYLRGPELMGFDGYGRLVLLA